MFAIFLACSTVSPEPAPAEAAEHLNVKLPSSVALGEQVSMSVGFTQTEGCARTLSKLSEPSPNHWVLAIEREPTSGHCSDQTSSTTVGFPALRPGPSSFQVLIDGKERATSRFEVGSSPPFAEDDGAFVLDLDDETRWKLLAALLPDDDEEREPLPDASGTWTASSHSETREARDMGYVTTWSDGRVDWELFGPGESATRVQLCLLTVRAPTRDAVERGPYCEPVSAWSPDTSITIGTVVHTRVEPDR